MRFAEAVGRVPEAEKLRNEPGGDMRRRKEGRKEIRSFACSGEGLRILLDTVLKKKIIHPVFGEVTVFRTRRARRISVSVRPPGTVCVTLPAGCPLREGLAFLAAKEAWVRAARERMERLRPVRLLEPPYATCRHALRWLPAAEGSAVSCRVTEDAIVVSFPPSMAPSAAEVQAAAREGALRALRAEAKAVLPAMVAELAARYGFRYGKVTVRATRSRWGSCSSRDDISLSIFLMRLPQHLIEYIIVHELCHTRFKDHSAGFHALVDSLLGGREKELARELRSYAPDVV